MWTLFFWQDAGERALRTAAQAVIALWAGSVTGILDVDWIATLSVSSFAGLLSILMSIAATKRGDDESASFLLDR